jgi:hypothetical protein
MNHPLILRPLLRRFRRIRRRDVELRAHAQDDVGRRVPVAVPPAHARAHLHGMDLVPAGVPWVVYPRPGDEQDVRAGAEAPVGIIVRVDGAEIRIRVGGRSARQQTDHGSDQQREQRKKRQRRVVPQFEISGA